MITEDYVSFEVAKLLREKGFDEPTTGTYHKDGTFEHLSLNKWNSKFIMPISAPTLQMTMKWLREIYKLFIEISVSIDLNGNYHYSYSILDKECKYIRKGYTSFDWNYKEAVEAALKYSLENLI